MTLADAITSSWNAAGSPTRQRYNFLRHSSRIISLMLLFLGVTVMILLNVSSGIEVSSFLRALVEGSHKR